MTNGVLIEVNKEDIKKVKKALGRMQKDTPRHLKNAINRTATQTNKMIDKGRGAGYVIEKGTFKGHINIQRATNAHLDATIKATDKPHGLGDISRFHLSGSNFAGYNVETLKGKSTPIVGNKGQKAFVAGVPWKSKSGKSGTHYGLFIRKDKERLPIHYASGPGVSKMVEKIYQGEVGGQGDIEGRTRERLQMEIRKELDKIVGKG